MKNLLFLLFVFTNYWVSAQNTSLKNYPDDSTSAEIILLRNISPEYSNIPKELELPMLRALSHFPELKGSKIKFKLSRISTTMNARPTMGSLLFNSKLKRTYIVRINKFQKDSVISIFEVPFSAQTGIFGHEFSHFVDYSKLSFWGIIKRGINYTNPKIKSDYEKETDRMTIHHGLGNELLEWSDYVLNRSNATEKYKAFKRSTYLTPSEIKEEQMRLPAQ